MPQCAKPASTLKMSFSDRSGNPVDPFDPNASKEKESNKIDIGAVSGFLFFGSLALVGVGYIFKFLFEQAMAWPLG
jgi:hypothetical protein